MQVMLFYIGMCLGSFCQVVAYRYPRKVSFILGRSYCEKCHHELSFRDTLPFISFILLKGKCRYCGKKISKRYLYLELLYGVCFYMLVMTKYNLLNLSLSVFISMLLFMIALIDMDTMYVYDGMIVGLGCFCILYSLILGNDFLFMMKGALSISLPMYIISKIFKDSFGFGDIELLFVMGILIGDKLSFMAFYVAVMSACLIAIIQKSELRDWIPFCPFLCFGFIFALLLVG